MVDTIKFSQMTDGGDIANNDMVPGLQSGINVLFNNPWTFLPPGNTAQRPAPSAAINYRLRFNTEEQLYEYYDAVLGAWTQLQESLFTQGPFVIYTADPSIPDGQNLGDLADGILKQTITAGVATIDIAVNGTDFYGPGYTGYINAPAGIADINGNPILNTVSAGASSVNYLRIANNITGNGPSISAQGSDTNIALNILSKGAAPIGLITQAINEALFIYNGTSNQHLTRFSFANTAADRIVTWPDASGTVAFGEGTVASLQGTENQVLVNGTFGTPVTGTDIILTTPQDIGLTSSPTFDNLQLSGGLIVGSDGTTVFELVNTALSVNHIRATSEPTGTSPSLRAIGTDTDVSLTLRSQGAGVISLVTQAPTQPILIYSGTGSQHLTRFNMANTAADRSIIWPDASGTVAFVGSTISSVQGTQNQVLVNGTFGTPITGTDIIFTTPQDIGTSSAVSFGSVTTTGLIQATGARLFSGSSSGGFAGGIGLYSPTAAMGSLQLLAADNGGNFGTIITNAPMGQVTTFTLPDPVSSSTSFLLSTAGATQHVTAFSFQVDAGSLISGLNTGSSAGRFIGFSPTASMGSISVTAADNAGNFSNVLTHASTSAARTWTLPNATGTIALTSDLTGFVTSVSGTTNRITSTGGTTPVIDIAGTYVGQTSITTLGTIGTGTWNASVILGQYGGTGIANTGKTITLGGNLTTSGAFNSTFTMTGTTTVTFPTSGTLATTAETVSSITGTVNQVIASASTGAVTLSLPQDIGTSSNVNFGNVTVNTSSAIPISSYSSVASSTPFASSNQFNLSCYNQDATNNNWQFIVFNDHSGNVSSAIGTQITNQSNGTADLYIYTKPSGGAITSQIKIASTGIVSLTQPLPATSGGNGFASYGIGDILYANTTTTLAKLSDVVTGNALISGGVSTAPSWGKIDLTTHVSGILPYANGGSNASTSWTPGSIFYAGASAQAQDNANFFWDATNHRLGLGTTSPFYILHAQVANNTTMLLRDPTGVGVDGGTSGILFSIADTSVTTDQYAKGGIFFEKVNADGSAKGKLHLCVNTASDSTNASKSNAIITLYNGFVQLNSTSFTANATTATVLTSLGPAGANTTVQEWLTIKNAGGTTRYIPCF